jgi:hypothetical protein
LREEIEMNRALVIVMAVAASVPFLGVQEARAQARPEFCVLNQANENDGVGLSIADSGLSAQPNGVMASCVYKRSNGNPLPLREYGFRILCPQGKNLVLGGYTFPRRVMTGLAIVTWVPGTDSAGRDFMDMGVDVKMSNAMLEVTTYALCR